MFVLGTRVFEVIGAMVMPKILEHENERLSCKDFIIYKIKQVLNLQPQSFLLYERMNSAVMKLILDDLHIGAGVFSP